MIYKTRTNRPRSIPCLEWIVPATVVLSLSTPDASALTLLVPAEYPTIQAAVDAAATEGDSILAGPGHYPEDVVVSQKAVHIIGIAGRDSTSARSFHWGDPGPWGTPAGSLVGFEVQGKVTAIDLMSRSPSRDARSATRCGASSFRTIRTRS